MSESLTYNFIPQDDNLLRVVDEPTEGPARVIKYPRRDRIRSATCQWLVPTRAATSGSQWWGARGVKGGQSLAHREVILILIVTLSARWNSHKENLDLNRTNPGDYQQYENITSTWRTGAERFCYVHLSKDSADYVTRGKCKTAIHFRCAVLSRTTWKAKALKEKQEWECDNCRVSRSRKASLGLDEEEPDDPTFLALIADSLEEKTNAMQNEIEDLRTSLECERQYNRSKNVIITSVPQIEREDVGEIVIKLLKKMDFDIKKKNLQLTDFQERMVRLQSSYSAPQEVPETM
ncbi:hypothetical protein J6590_053391 [Homalodisca vitripennis]|nr:hypothetical protein J6590_053391 [Homalodisca vitripennis]